MIKPRPKNPLEPAESRRERLRAALLAWYDRAGRDLPWRTRNGQPDPYRVWLSEIMLQQTTVAAVGPYYVRFLDLFPTVAALANAPRETVLEAWAGLGYYSRARNLHAAAQKLAAEGFPLDETGWRALPGVGAYTAAAVAAIALDQPANVVDGNVERVMARLHAVEEPLPTSKLALKALAADYVAADRPGDWAQALMDLGATVCTPRAPLCSACPWRADCAAYATGSPETYPRKRAKAARPERCGAAFVLTSEQGLWLVRRPEQGLLAGMAGLPTTPWREDAWSQADALAHAPVKAKWKHAGAVRHVFTHFALTLDVYAATGPEPREGWWGDARALPTVFRKAAAITR